MLQFHRCRSASCRRRHRRHSSSMSPREHAMLRFFTSLSIPKPKTKPTTCTSVLHTGSHDLIVRSLYALQLRPWLKAFTAVDEDDDATAAEQQNPLPAMYARTHRVCLRTCRHDYDPCLLCTIDDCTSWCETIHSGRMCRGWKKDTLIPTRVSYSILWGS